MKPVEELIYDESGLVVGSTIRYPTAEELMELSLRVEADFREKHSPGHIVGMAAGYEVDYLADESDASRIIDRFNYCPRCGEKLK